MADDLLAELLLPTRDQIRDKRLRDYALRNRTADTREGSEPFIGASVFADSMAGVYANAKTIADDADLEKKTGKSLRAYARSIGLPSPDGLPAAGASGFVKINASVGGATIVAGTILQQDGGANLKFQCTSTGLYGDGAAVPIAGLSTGPVTNLPAGAVLKWQAAPPGLGPIATVLPQSNGAGLQGGADAETNEGLRDRIRERQSNPPAAGNAAAYIEAIENIPGLAVQKAFALPAIKGPGSTGLCFTMQPSAPGAGRRPSSTQIAIVAAQLVGAFPGDDSQFVCTLLQSRLPLTFTVTWSRQGRGWVDASPWPPKPASPPASLVRVDAGGPTITPLFCRVTNTAGSVAAPVAGQTIGLYDTATGTFRRKRIASVSVVSVGLSWDLTFDATNNASDLGYTPVDQQIVSPWADSLQLLVTPILLYIDSLGPGEQVASFFDAELRQRREPESPAAWPSDVTSRILAPLYSLTAIQDIAPVWPALPIATSVGTPGVSSYLHELIDLAAFAT